MKRFSLSKYRITKPKKQVEKEIAQKLKNDPTNSYLEINNLEITKDEKNQGIDNLRKNKPSIYELYNWCHQFVDMNKADNKEQNIAMNDSIEKIFTSSELSK